MKYHKWKQEEDDFLREHLTYSNKLAAQYLSASSPDISVSAVKSRRYYLGLSQPGKAIRVDKVKLNVKESEIWVTYTEDDGTPVTSQVKRVCVVHGDMQRVVPISHITNIEVKGTR